MNSLPTLHGCCAATAGARSDLHGRPPSSRRACVTTSRCRATPPGTSAARPTSSSRRATAPTSSPSCASLPADVPLLWLGLGSNLLVRDGGMRGVVISTHEALTALERRGERDVYCRGRRALREARAAVRALGPRPGGVLRRHSRHARRRAGDERRRVRRRDLARTCARSRRSIAAARVRGVRPASTAPATGTSRRRRTTSGSSPRRCTSTAGSSEAADARAARAAPRDAADRRVELRLGVHESAR